MDSDFYLLILLLLLHLLSFHFLKIKVISLFLLMSRGETGDSPSNHSPTQLLTALLMGSSLLQQEMLRWAVFFDILNSCLFSDKASPDIALTPILWYWEFTAVKCCLAANSSIKISHNPLIWFIFIAPFGTVCK